jgi:hypothetical protein
VNQGGGNVPESDHNVQGPLVEIFVLVDADLAGTANLLEIVGKGVVDLAHQGVQPGLPLAHQITQLLAQVHELVVRRLHLLLQLGDFLLALLKLPDDVGVGCVDELEVRLLGRDLHSNLRRRLFIDQRVVCLSLVAVVAEDFRNLVAQPRG